MKVDTNRGYLHKPRPRSGYKIESYYCECGCKSSYYHYVIMKTKEQCYWFNALTTFPSHKELVIVWDGINVLPAIFYDNNSFKGFYHFTTYYSTHNVSTYSKTRLKDKHKINNVKEWVWFPNYNTIKEKFRELDL